MLRSYRPPNARVPSSLGFLTAILRAKTHRLIDAAQKKIGNTQNSPVVALDLIHSGLKQYTSDEEGFKRATKESLLLQNTL